MHAEEASSKNVEQSCQEPQARVGIQFSYIQCENPGYIELGTQEFLPISWNTEASSSSRAFSPLISGDDTVIHKFTGLH